MRRFIMSVLAVAALSGPAFAQDAATPPAPVTAPAPDASEKICVDQNPTASTRVNSQRLCRTRAEWEKRGGVPR